MLGGAGVPPSEFSLAGSFVEGVVCFPATSLASGGRDDGTTKAFLIRWDVLRFDGAPVAQTKT